MALAKKLGEKLQGNDVLCFFGDLGSGKTTFIKGVVEGFSGYPARSVSSPTFTYLNIYEGVKQTVYHFDLYRLRDTDEFLSMGFDEYLSAGGVCCVEWSERIEEVLLGHYTRIIMSLSDGGGRDIEIIET